MEVQENELKRLLNAFEDVITMRLVLFELLLATKDKGCKISILKNLFNDTYLNEYIEELVKFVKNATKERS